MLSRRLRVQLSAPFRTSTSIKAPRLGLARPLGLATVRGWAADVLCGAASVRPAAVRPQARSSISRRIAFAAGLEGTEQPPSVGLPGGPASRARFRSRAATSARLPKLRMELHVSVAGLDGPEPSPLDGPEPPPLHRMPVRLSAATDASLRCMVPLVSVHELRLQARLFSEEGELLSDSGPVSQQDEEWECSGSNEANKLLPLARDVDNQRYIEKTSPVSLLSRPWSIDVVCCHWPQPSLARLRGRAVGTLVVLTRRMPVQAPGAPLTW